MADYQVPSSMYNEPCAVHRRRRDSESLQVVPDLSPEKKEPQICGYAGHRWSPPKTSPNPIPSLNTNPNSNSNSSTSRPSLNLNNRSQILRGSLPSSNSQNSSQSNIGGQARMVVKRGHGENGEIPSQLAQALAGNSNAQLKRRRNDGEGSSSGPTIANGLQNLMAQLVQDHHRANPNLTLTASSTPSPRPNSSPNNNNNNTTSNAMTAATSNSNPCTNSNSPAPRIVNAHWPPAFKPIYVQVTRIKIILPIKSIASMNSLKARAVTDKKVHEALFEEFTKIGCAGRDYKGCIDKILNALVLPEVKARMSWEESDGKMEFGNSSVCQTVFQAVRFHHPRVSDAELEIIAQNWLRTNPTV